MLFPLGEMTKREVRAIARREGIPTWAKKDSTGICFIGERPFRDFLARYLPRAPGPIETPDGRRRRRRTTVSRTTRSASGRGCGIGGTRDGDDAPWFVAGKDMARNALIVVQGHDHPLLYRRDVEAIDMHWIAGAAPATAGAIRREDALPDARCRVRRVERCGRRRAARRSTRRNGRRRPDSISSLYDGDVCLGGGVIAGSSTSAPAGCAGALAFSD